MMFTSPIVITFVIVTACRLLSTSGFSAHLPPKNRYYRHTYFNAPLDRATSKYNAIASTRSKQARSSFCLKSATKEFGNAKASSRYRNEQLPDPQSQQRSKHWVVIIDDEEPIRQAVGQYLFERGYQVTACADAETALSICRSTTAGSVNESPSTQQNPKDVPDVIVSDIRMPQMDGLEFLRIVRSDPNLEAIPVILLTAKGRTEDRIEGYKSGADAYLPKPFSPDELLSIIDNVVDKHEALCADYSDVQIGDLQRDLDDIKHLLLEEGGGGVGNGWVQDTNVFFQPDEKVVLEHLCRGLTNGEIAKEAHISRRRVEQHLTSLFKKTECRNRTELVRWAISTGNVDID